MAQVGPQDESLPSIWIETVNDSTSIISEYSSIIDILDNASLLTISQLEADHVHSFTQGHVDIFSNYTPNGRTPSIIAGNGSVGLEKRPETLGSIREQLQRLVDQIEITNDSGGGMLDILAMARRLEDSCSLQSDACYGEHAGSKQVTGQSPLDTSVHSYYASHQRREPVGIDPDGVVGTNGSLNKNKHCRSSNTERYIYRKQQESQYQYEQEQSQKEVKLGKERRRGRQGNGEWCKNATATEQQPGMRFRQAEPIVRRENTDTSEPDNAQHWKLAGKGHPQSRPPVYSKENNLQRRRNNLADSGRWSANRQRNISSGSLSTNNSGSRSTRRNESPRFVNSTRAKRLSSFSCSSKSSRQPHRPSLKKSPQSRFETVGHVSTSGSSDDISSCSSSSNSLCSDEDDACDYDSNDSTSIEAFLSVADAVQYLNENKKVGRMANAASALRGNIRSKFLSTQVS
eukprot:CAMPEP_0172298076 /NCGR_PEP_ID=MMETSP1058-20130122/880_1 /TAXON_ID=83371 /ORGANISM="Detonula confervacea, Strain CCMP 353" /LENGTH=458 /DNA_ID=CAMNT_0013007315 /DNA_START=618 /DNA_END=1994 /DNA_ORIENTATION=+